MSRSGSTDGRDGGGRMGGTTDTFERHRRLLFSVSYDILGSAADAEDCVQEAWIRWARGDRSGVADPRSYLVRTVANITLNRVRAVRNQREAYVGPWLPEPLLTSPDVADQVVDADSVSYAMLVVLQTLGPVERAVFVLREVFGIPHAEIAEAVGRSESSVRQLAHRAREHVHARRPRYPADTATRRRLTERFLDACLEGDLDGLKEMLADDAVMFTDGGGKAKAARRPVRGADPVARFCCAVASQYRDARAEPHGINGTPGLLIRDMDGTVITTITLEVAGDLVTDIHAMRNPDKLRHLDTAPPDRGGEW